MSVLKQEIAKESIFKTTEQTGTRNRFGVGLRTIIDSDKYDCKNTFNKDLRSTFIKL